MNHRVRIRQERPQYTRAEYRQRWWELHVMNTYTGAYEYYASTWTHTAALALAPGVWARSNNVRRPHLQEVPC